MRPSDFARRVALAAHAALILGVALRQPSALSLVLAAILCLPLPGLFRARSYTFAWAAMMVGFFVAGYLADGYARPQARLGAFALASVAAVDFISLMMFVRWRAREIAAAARTAASDGALR